MPWHAGIWSPGQGAGMDARDWGYAPDLTMGWNYLLVFVCGTKTRTKLGVHIHLNLIDYLVLKIALRFSASPTSSTVFEPIAAMCIGRFFSAKLHP